VPGKRAKAKAAKTTNAIQPDGDGNARKGSPGIAYPPYVNAYGAIPKLFKAITAASVPPKFNQDFMESVLDMKSSSHRALIPLLKRLGFLDQANVPTEQYRRVRDKDLAGRTMAQQVRAAYADLYKANEYAHRLDRKELSAKLTSVPGSR